MRVIIHIDEQSDQNLLPLYPKYDSKFIDAGYIHIDEQSDKHENPLNTKYDSKLIDAGYYPYR